MHRLAIASAAFVVLTACAAGIGEPPENNAVPTSASQSTTPTARISSGGMEPEMIDSLINQASQETGVGTDEIRIVSADAVTWSDGSIGCPEEGTGYTQALVSGYRVILDVAGEEIHYHASSDGDFFACDKPQEPIDDGTVDR